jgi:putative DNA primase/helicase
VIPSTLQQLSSGDADLDLLGMPAKVCDLRTGAVREQLPEDYLTKSIADVPYAGNHPLWTAFLDKITGEDIELQHYLQRVAGYCLSGSTIEHVLFFLYGLGANGKTTFTNTLLGIWADYAQVLTENKNDRHPTELAALRGARLVVASETEVGKRWAESRIKALTGGERIRARFCRCDEFEFTPQFKLMIQGNHKPGLRAVDVAIRRRVHLIPFTVTVPPEERDPKLLEKLRGEWPQILAWAIEGHAEWQRQGLNPPQAVLDATEEYFQTEDVMLRWLEERCICLSQAGSTRTRVLYEDFKAWAEAAGEYCNSQKRFSQDLIDRGYTIRKSHGSSVVDEIALRTKEPEV